MSVVLSIRTEILEESVMCESNQVKQFELFPQLPVPALRFAEGEQEEAPQQGASANDNSSEDWPMLPFPDGWWAVS